MLLSAPVQGFRLERRGGGGWGFYLFIGRFSASSPLRLCEEGRGLEEWIPLPNTHTHACTPFLPLPRWPCSLPRGTPLRQSTLTSIRAWCSREGRDSVPLSRTYMHEYMRAHTNSRAPMYSNVQGECTEQQEAHSPHSYESQTQSVSVTLLLFPHWATLKYSFVYILHSNWTCFQRALQRLSYTSAAVPLLDQ